MCTHFNFQGSISRSPGQVKVGTSHQHRYLSSKSCCEHWFSLNGMKLLGYDTGKNTYKQYISDFHFRELRTAQFFTLFHYKPMVKCVFFSYNFWTNCDIRVKWHQYACLITPNQIICKLTYFDVTWPLTLGQTLVFTFSIYIGNHSICLDGRNTMVTASLLLV